MIQLIIKFRCPLLPQKYYLDSKSVEGAVVEFDASQEIFYRLTLFGDFSLFSWDLLIGYELFYDWESQEYYKTANFLNCGDHCSYHHLKNGFNFLFKKQYRRGKEMTFFEKLEVIRT